MRRWILPITGFRQSVARPTGLERLWSALRQFSAPDCVVSTPLPWNADMRGLAAFVARNTNGPARVLLVAYSWGAGVGAINFACEAWRIGVEIPLAVLCDPVYRSPLLPTWMPINPLSLTSAPRIEVPPSVAEVRWLRQQQDSPRGHDLVAELPAETKIRPPVWVNAKHGDIDESAEFHHIALAAAEEFVGKL